MPGPASQSLGNISLDMILNVTLSPATIATVTVAEQTFAVAGLLVGDMVVVNKPTAQAGIGIAGSRVVSAGVLGISFVNPTAGTLTPTASEIYRVAISRCENTIPPSGIS